MKELSIDIETWSSVDLNIAGRHKYVEAQDFTILLFAYSIDDDPAQIVDFTNLEELPKEIYKALTDPDIIKSAHNAPFEEACINKYFSVQSGPWDCTANLGASLGYPRSLKDMGAALNLATQKDRNGTALIKLFCTPPRRFGPDDKWQAFKEYCIQDVVVEKAIKKCLRFYLWRDPEMLAIDKQINDSGVLIDTELVRQAMIMDAINRKKLIEEAQALTGVENPNSVKQIKDWIETELPMEVDEAGELVQQEIANLGKENVVKLLAEITDTKIKRILQIRQELSKSSIKKYSAMLSGLCADGRVKGTMQYLGAPRTGRWAGRILQTHNLVRNKLKDLDLARQLVKSGDIELVENFFGSVSNTLSELVRTAIVPAPGNKFIISDFSAIEARVTAWFANEKWRLDVFRGDGKIYEASAAMMFKIPVEKITKDSPWREKGKIAELALGFGGGVNAIRRMDSKGELKNQSDRDILNEIVYPWRQTSSRIVHFWKQLEYNCQKIMAPNDPIVLDLIADNKILPLKYLKFSRHKNMFFIQLPSGRSLAYDNLTISWNDGWPETNYNTLHQVSGKWGRTNIYGGKFTENVVQATARDILAEKIKAIHRAGFKIVMHVHDEIVVECPIDTDKRIIQQIMKAPIKWAPGLPLNEESFESFYYKKG